MVYSNSLNTYEGKLNYAVPYFKANENKYNLVIQVKDTEKRVIIDYALDLDFKKGKLYNIVYEIKRKELLKNSSGLIDASSKIVNCGYCRLVCTERIISHDSAPLNRFIFSKVKSRKSK